MERIKFTELKIADRVALPVPADVAPPEAPVRRRKQS